MGGCPKRKHRSSNLRRRYDNRRTDSPRASISFTAFLSKEMKVSAPSQLPSWAITPSAKSPPAANRANECGQLLMFWKGGNTILVDFLPELVPPAFSEDEGSQAEDDLCALWGPAHPRTTQPLFDQSFACGLCDA